MTTPDVEYRIELTVELPGTPEQVWDAIATAKGITAWMLPTELEERLGGRVVFHMGDDVSSEGTITGWDPPRRVAYEEPNWPALAGRETADVTPIASEFVIEARSGGTCVLRVVSSAFGTGADWEREFFADMERGWRPCFDVLRRYLERFPGRQATSMVLERTSTQEAKALRASFEERLGVQAVGQHVEVRGLQAQVEQIDEFGLRFLLADPVPGFLSLWAQEFDGAVSVRLDAALFADDAPGWVERERAGWEAWLEGLAA
jgi:uncharacterized protein YndB with AHSA1/START domain